MAKIETPRELFVHELGAALTMEKTTLGMLEELEQEANDPQLKQNLRHHLVFFKEGISAHLDVKCRFCKRDGSKVLPVRILKQGYAHLDLAQLACILLVGIKI